MRALARKSCHRQHKSQTDDNDSDDNSQQSTNNQQSAAATSLTAPPTATPPQTPLSEPQLKSESEAGACSWQRLESRASEWGRRLFSLPYLIFACCFRWGSIRLLCTVPSKRRDWFRFGRAGCGLSHFYACNLQLRVFFNKDHRQECSSINVLVGAKRHQRLQHFC